MQVSASFGDLIGPVYSVTALAKMWGLHEEQAAGLADALELLVVRPADGPKLYPVLQFSGTQMRSDVSRVAAILREAIDDATIVQWFLTPCIEDTDGRTHLQLLDDDKDHVIGEAAIESVRWLQAYNPDKEPL